MSFHFAIVNSLKKTDQFFTKITIQLLGTPMETPWLGLDGCSKPKDHLLRLQDLEMATEMATVGEVQKHGDHTVSMEKSEANLTSKSSIFIIHQSLIR